ncbi:hypothetical protein Pla108_04800 [Botrimarina colliarenosi]|uniref:Uncharacterized protein n=1 Tax=Botrimarina colliarenosi TaxID=2528001 RepID=A0A5C6AJ94_9BACT|nr:hypothetical protein [Botrimarina colliarenosi]TWT99537.1 hypothetical protein Pla108_04800 [Botrimarina colliarenosi]
MSLRRIPTARCLLALALVATAARSAEPQQARLTIDEAVYNVPLGKAFAVRIGGERVTLRIDPQSDNAFEAAGVAFRYPSSLKASDTAGGDDVQVWTLQGLSAAVMLQKYAAGLDAKSLRDVLVENLIEREGVSDKQQRVKLTGAERGYEGAQLRYQKPAQGKAPATETVQNVFTFANAEGIFALMVQDVHAPGEEESDEYAETLRLLGESLVTGEEPAPPEAPAEPPR